MSTPVQKVKESPDRPQQFYLVSITRQMPRHKNKAIEGRAVILHANRIILTRKLVLVVVVIGLMKTRLKQIYLAVEIVCHNLVFSVTRLQSQWCINADQFNN